MFLKARKVDVRGEKWSVKWPRRIEVDPATFLYNLTEGDVEWAEGKGVDVFEAFSPTGLCRPDEKEILVVENTDSEDETLKTLIHEVTHAAAPDLEEDTVRDIEEALGDLVMRMLQAERRRAVNPKRAAANEKEKMKSDMGIREYGYSVKRSQNRGGKSISVSVTLDEATDLALSELASAWGESR